MFFPPRKRPVDLLDLKVVRGDAREEIGKLTSERRVHAA
jgi:hypothetical protein